MKKDKNNHEIDLNKYQDLNGLSVDKMNFGLWLSENRSKIMRIIIVILIAVSAFFFVYSTYNYVVYFLDKSNDSATVDTGVTSPRNVTAELVVNTPQLFKSGETYDIIATISNPNDKFVAHYNYCFSNESVDIYCGSSFIMPGEQKYISALGQTIAKGSISASLKLSNVSWQRIDSHEITDWSVYANDRINFNIENIQLNLSELDSLEFSITNRSNYSYYEVPLNIVFYNGQEIIGTNRTVVKLFLSGETRNVHLTWPGGLSGVTRTDIRPELDLLNDGIYLKYQGETK